MNKKIIFVVGILLIIGVGTFIFLQQKAFPTVSPEIKKAQQEMMENCKYDLDFCKYAAHSIVAMSNGYTLVSESSYNGKKSKMVLKSDGKENSESVSYTDGEEEGSFISLNEITYMKGKGETVWTEFPASKDETGKQTTNLFDFEGLKKELGNVKKDSTDLLNVKKTGVESCGRFTCFLFEMTEKVPSSTTRIWVDTKEYLARKMEIKSKEGTSIMTFEYSPVRITQPSPVKKMPAFDVNLNSDDIENIMKNIPQTDQQESTPAEEIPEE